MSGKVTLFQKITLENLMLHEKTTVDLFEKSITLITGANGSGKTQILDGIILCIGHIPSRAKAKGVGSLVGKNGDNAKAILELANPIVNGKRAIITLDNDLNSVINFDTFTITAKISEQDSSILYSINDSRRIIRGRLVTRGDIRRIFDSIGVRGDNRLAFTGEGTVDEFASKSPKRKLDVLLEVTGLKQYREEVIASQEILKSSIQEIEPLKRKLETETKLLNLWNDALNILKQKKKLMIMKTKLDTEMAWSHVIRLEKRLELLNKERLKVLKQRSDNDQAIKEKEDEIDLLKRKIKNLNDELNLHDEQERQKNRQVITLETQIENNNENVNNFKKEIKRYLEQKAGMEKILATKDLSTKDRQIQDKQEALAVKLKKLSLIQEKYAKAEKELQINKNQIYSEPDFDIISDEEIFSGKRLTRYEEEMVNTSKFFLQKLKQNSSTEEIIGPIISLISIKKEHKKYETAVKNLIGRNLYAFIAKDEDSYRLAKRIYDEIWPKWKPPLTVFRGSLDDAKKASTILPKPQFKEIYEVATNLIDGNPFAVGLLKRINNQVVADDKYDVNSLTNIAKIARVNILTRSGQSYYLYQGGFGRPPAPMNNPLGFKLVISNEKPSYLLDADERRIRVAIARLEKEQRDFKLEEIKTLNEISKLHLEIQSLGLPDEKILGKIETINEIIASIEAKISECNIHHQELSSDFTQAQDGFNSFFERKFVVSKRISEIQESIDLSRIELHSLNEKASRLLTLELNFDSEYEEFLTEKKERETIAKTKGDKPEEIREYSEIRDEMNRIEGHLESIGISNVDEEKIEAQKIKVESLKKYMTEREEHITNLRGDLEARLVFWNGELQEVITNISRSMKLLLGGIFDKIRLKVTNINKPEEAGLFIEAITKGVAYRDFRELSGGEKVLAIEGLILAMHTLTDSPIHAIDEFTQRLDEKNKALAFSIAVRTQKLASENSRFVPQFMLLCPEAIDVKLSDDIHHVVVSETKVIKVEHPR
ncbi:MAG TPA: AAA family ATPase [Candidatus Glassbacteria bacterium]|nr:AAA family ATPase [Candidatus Glassbacteria bacterium]